MSARGRRIARALVVLAFAGLELPARAEAGVSIPTHVFAGEPRGPHTTGTVEMFWVDEARGEPATPDPNDRRHLAVQIWYPATFQGDPPRAPYVLRRELYPADEESAWLDSVLGVRTNSVLGVALAAAPKRFPILLYNPGASHPPFSATFQTEFLASHGYVVVAVGHTDITRIQRFPDGYVYGAYAEDPEPLSPPAGESSMAEQFRSKVERSAAELMPLHVRDLSFVLDRLAVLDAAHGSRFHGRLDLERVGSLGWSLGGALSLQASRDEPRIKAAANLDGWLYTDVQETGTPRPVLVMHGGAPFADEQEPADARERRLVAEMLPWRLYARTGAEWYDVTLKRAEHDHFSDRTLFEPQPPALIHPRAAHELINLVTLGFFDKHLRQAPDSPWLSGRHSHPDLEIHRKGDSP